MSGTSAPRLTVVVLLVLFALAGCQRDSAPTTTARPSTSTMAASTTSTSTTVVVSTTQTRPARNDLQSLLDVARTTYGAPGALAVVRLGDESWAGVSGEADLTGTRITGATRFRIASITKPIVAALVLDAVSRGELSLDAVVADLLPGLVRADPPITVRMLLDHTSGVFDEGNEGDPVTDIGRIADAAIKAEAQDLLARYLAGESIIAPDRVLVAMAETHDRYFPPGEGYHYSNTNYQLAGMVLEQVTGDTLDHLLRTRIVEPLGLRHTTLAPPDVASPELRGYGTSGTDDSLVDITDDLTFFGNGGNGGIISTGDELLTIMQAIVAGKLLPPELVTHMEQPTFQSNGSYGLGLATYYLTCGVYYGHEGGVNGTASIALVSPDAQNGVVIALNLRNGSDPHLPALADQFVCGADEDTGP